MIKLYPDQDELVQKVRDEIAKGHKRILLRAETGSGKTAIATYIIQRANQNGKKCSFVVPRKQLLKQTALTFHEFDMPNDYAYIAAGEWYDESAKNWICSMQTLCRRLLYDSQPDIVIIDECFPSYQKVDGKPISEIKCGDKIKSYNHKTNKVEYRTVQAARKMLIDSAMCRVKLSSGLTIDSTLRHPYYVEGKGYIEARKIEKGDYVLQLQGVQNQNREAEQSSTQENEGIRGNVLLKRMCKKVIRYAGIGPHEKEQPNAKARECRKDARNAESDWAQANSQGWQWKGNADSARGAVATIRGWLDSRICGNNVPSKTYLQLPKLLQNRHSKSKVKDSNRSRWGESRNRGEKSAGQEEGRCVERVRVESVEIFKQRSDERYKRMLGDGYVYNLQVEDNNNYFIDGTLVHNCHFGAAQLELIIDHYTAAGCIIIGLSATPEKQNGKAMGDWYDVMVEGPDLRWLIDNGRLSDYRVFVPHTVSVEGLRVSNGDYSKSEADARIEADRVLVGSAIDYYKQHAFGKRHMTFAQNIKRSKEMARDFTDAGVPSAHMDGDTPKTECEKIINKFADGEIMNLCTVDMCLFGFDLSAQVGRDVPVESMSDCRLTKSRNVQRQKWGRVLRRKDYPALIFDHVGNALPERHGLPCDPQEWSLEGKKKRTRKQEEERSEQNRQCLECFHIHPVAPSCPNCGYVYPKQTPKELEQIEGELVELQKQQERKEKRREEGMCQTLEEWQELAKERGHKSGWAYHRWKARQK